MNDWFNILNALYKWSRKSVMVERGQSKLLNIFKYGYNRQFLSMHLLYTGALSLIGVVICLRFIPDLWVILAVQSLIPLLICGIMLLSENMGMLRSGNTANIRNAKSELTREVGIFTAILVIIPVMFCTAMFYYMIRFDINLRYVTFVVVELLFYIFCYLILQFKWRRKNPRIKFWIEDCKKWVSLTPKIDNAIPYISARDSLFIVEKSGRVKSMNYIDKEQSYYLAVVGKDCLVKVSGLCHIKEVYNCWYIVTKTLNNTYEKWYYDNFSEMWVSKAYKLNKKMSECIKSLT